MNHLVCRVKLGELHLLPLLHQRSGEGQEIELVSNLSDHLA